jgi:hypothetical protein
MGRPVDVFVITVSRIPFPIQQKPGRALQLNVSKKYNIFDACHLIMLEKTSLVFQSLFAPRETYRKIQTKPELDASLLLAVLLGISLVFSRLINPDVKVLMKILMLGGSIILTVISLVLFAYLINLISGFFKKEDVSNALRLAIPYAFLPSIIVNFLWFVMPAQINLFVQFGATLWFLILLSALVSELKKLDFIRSFLSVLVASLILSMPVIVYQIGLPLMAKG